MRMMILLASTMLAAAPSSSPSVKAGIDAWQKHDYAAAVAIWKPLAAKGDTDAAFNLGQAYRLGRGVPIDLAVAQDYLGRAARKGHVDAETTLGLLLFDSNDRVGGLRWLKAASNAGEPRALLIYGTALFNGDGVPRNPVLAYALVSRAAAQGLAPAKATLAQMDAAMPLDQRQQGVALAQAEAAPSKAAPARAPAKTALAKAIPVKTAAAGTKPIARPAAPVAVASSKPVAPSGASGSWRVQLGAFSNHAAAQALFKRLSGSSALAGRQPYLVPVGAITRLQAGPFATRAAAAAACATLKGQACFPVAGK